MPMTGEQARAAGIYKPDARKVEKAAEDMRKAGPQGFQPVGLPSATMDAIAAKLRGDRS